MFNRAAPLFPWCDESVAANGRAVKANFADWFSQSKVRDALGRPLIVYHGTSLPDGQAFDSFDIERCEVGAHFSVNTSASQYFVDNAREGHVGLLIPVYLRIENPVRVKDLGAWDAYQLTEELCAAGALSAKQSEALHSLIENGAYKDATLRSMLIANGIDGLVYLNRGEGVDTEAGGGWESHWSDQRFKRQFPAVSDAYIAFSPEQIKSADSNSGLFLKHSASITDLHASQELKAACTALAKTISTERKLSGGPR